MVTCECGCGETPPRHPYTDRKKGIKAGDYMRFVFGHRARLTAKKTWDDYPPPVRDAVSGCLRWQGTHHSAGYGLVGREYAHIVAYERDVGPVPEGMELDHVAKRGCLYRDCVETAHLEPVTHAENLKRSQKILDQMARTHCPHGHEYTEENTRRRVTPSGGVKRECRTCTRLRNRENARKRRQAKKSPN